MKFYLAINKDSETVFSVAILQIEGCFATGETKEEAIEDAKLAILEHAKALVEMRIPLRIKPGGLEDFKKEFETDPEFIDTEWIEIEIENVPVFEFKKRVPRLAGANIAFNSKGSSDLFGAPDVRTNFGEIFRTVLRDEMITEEQLHTLMIEFVTQGYAVDYDRDKQIEVANLKKEVARIDMTWKVFRKGMIILGYNKVEMKFS